MNTYGIYKTFEDRVKEHVPNLQYKGEVKNLLYSIDWDQETNWKRDPFRQDQTLYDLDLARWSFEKKDLLKSKERLQKQFDDLLAKLGEEDEDPTLENKEEEAPSEEDTAVAEAATVAASIVENGRKQKGKPQQSCNRTKAQMARQEVAKAKGVKSALATVQTEIMELNNEIEALDKKMDCYTHYQQTNLRLLKRVRSAVQHYKDTQDRWYLEQNLYVIWEAFAEETHSYFKRNTCCKGDEGLCETHYLPLTTKPKWGGTSVSLTTNCILGPWDGVVYEEDDGSAW
jgi:hypothetical protein